MIIHRIHAENVLKYTSLRLDDLPERGLIAVTGPNESGKSTIGETLCFALFGRTFSLDYEDLDKVIHWGRTHCSVTVDFTATDGQRYTLERFLDDSGNHSARLARIGQEADAEPLARGVDKVADMVYELIGYEYEEFIESFYLAQREITTPHPHSYAVKTMAGLVTLEYCANRIQEEQGEMADAMEITRKESVGLAKQIEGVELDSDALPALQVERADLNSQLDGYNHQLSSLERASLDYQDALPKRDSATQGRGIAGFFAFLFFVLALVAAALWVLLTQYPEHGLNESLHELLPGMPSDWPLYGAIVLAVLFIISWARRSSLLGQMKQLDQVGQELASILTELTTDTPDPVTANDAEDQDPATATDPEVPDQAQRIRLSERVAVFRADFVEVREGVGREQNLLKGLIKQAQERAGQLDEAIAQEQTKIAKVEGLQAMQEDLERKNAERQNQIGVCDLAVELIQGSMREISHQFNHKIRGLVSNTLPLFTENRYEHLQIDEDLKVRVFSSEKHDFMDLEEISSGTQRQIMLAVRLALSQELVGRAVKASQFLFLDEPFAFFDQARTRSSLKVLPDLSEQLNQIWIIGQEFPDDLHFDHHIKCSREYRSLPPAEA
ncbi:MAG: AAA family ATPase [Chromatiales bacterium]|jgi:exonuclease SbcC